ncbi:Heavy metal-associated isoprenylated plant protein 32 [Camellia lanceoleosa]|uniref:Heavy metal-associated isoprenylated plant protein 32 n=1 Tax=Camellia lanceoleosa TaxID=1840588 RepID=A0ACC0J1F9_9ERIC|nr:Heavy metal-associated isoprenylated plant protein 32 [Camellia lanceoleosa]
MDDFMVAPKNFVLKLINHCQCHGCESKLKNLLQKIHGVHSTSIDAKKGKITITGTVRPHRVIQKLQKHFKKGVLLEQSPQVHNHNLQIAFEFHDQDLVPQMQQFSAIKGLKHVEVTYSKTVKLSFKGNKDELSHESDTQKKFVVGDEHGGGAATSEAETPWLKNFPPPPPLPPQTESGYNPLAPPWPEACAYTFEEFIPNSCTFM